MTPENPVEVILELLRRALAGPHGNDDQEWKAAQVVLADYLLGKKEQY